MDMKHKFYFVFGLLLAAAALLIQDVNAEPPQIANEAFTGEVKGRKVRVRLEPSVDSPIVQELSQGEMVVVSYAQNDFYAIEPPKNTKAYVYRTYVIDDIVEGNHVNVRSEPSLEAPVLAQLNKGDRIEGHVSPVNSKWLQIRLPDSVKFFVATEYIEKVGDVHYLKRLEQRKQEACAAVDMAHSACQDELCKPYPQINIEIATQKLREAAMTYEDIAEQRSRACDYIAHAHDNYVRKKIEYLENEAQAASETWNSRCQVLAQQMAAQSAHLDALERSLYARDADLIPEEPPKARVSLPVYEPTTLTDAMAVWIPHEAAAYQQWLEAHPNETMDEYYAEQADAGVQLRGGVQPYRRLIKNKPGNYLLVDHVDNIPIAFLYSTRVNLDSVAGKTVTLLVSPRPNNNFAFPAYYVLDVTSRK